MPYCSKCGAELDKDATFCPKCGTPAGPPVTKPERRTIQRRQRKPMSTRTIVLIVLLAAVVVVAAVLAAAFFLGAWHPFGQVVGSENLVTQEKFFSDFSVVEVESGFEVEITQSSSYSIKITADDNMFDYIEISQTGDTLTIGLKLGYSYRDVTLITKITMPDLYELKLSGGAHCTAKGFTSSHDFVLDLSGGSHIDELEGAADDLTISGSGGSHLDLSDFPVHDATVTLSGGSHATVNLDGRLDGDLSGGSHLKYVGNPATVDVNTSGGSTVGPQ